MGGATVRLVVLGSTRKKAEQGTKSRLANGAPPRPLHEHLPPGFPPSLSFFHKEESCGSISQINAPRQVASSFTVPLHSNSNPDSLGQQLGTRQAEGPSRNPIVTAVCSQTLCLRKGGDRVSVGASEMVQRVKGPCGQASQLESDPQTPRGRRRLSQELPSDPRQAHPK